MPQSTELTFTMLDSLRQTYDEMPRQLAFRATTRGEWEAWRAALRRTLVDVLGGFPYERSPLLPVLIEISYEDGYRIEKSTKHANQLYVFGVIFVGATE